MSYGEEDGNGTPPAPALGNTEDVTWDRTGGFSTKGRMEEQECWTLNTGGLNGVWRFIRVLQGLHLRSRPTLFHLQETSCDEHQWKGVERALKLLGYRSFHTMGTLDSKPSHGAWKRGIISAVSESVSSQWVDGFSWKSGQFQALDVNGTLCLNSYVCPDEASIQEHMSAIESFMIKTRWEGKWLFGGDWNEQWADSWIATVSSLNGGKIQDCSTICSTRWDSTKTIDYWVSNFDIGKAEIRDEKISDHKVVVSQVNFGSLLDSAYMKFVSEKQFKCPDWLSPVKWYKLFEEAFECGEKLHWDEAIEQVEQMSWPSEVDEQGLIDFQWVTVCAKLTWAFSVAAGYALNEIPENYKNIKEIQLVVSLANTRRVKGINPKLQRRFLQQNAARASEALRKLHKKEGRLTELKRRLTWGKLDSETFNLFKKLYPDNLCHEMRLEQVSDDLDVLHSLIQKREAKEKECCINTWKKKMQIGIKERGNWINKQGQLHTPSVRNGSSASTRQEGAEMIHGYWDDLWKNQNWTDEERKHKSQKVICRIKQKLAGQEFSGARPGIHDFRCALKRISGTHGIDGWAAHELRAISVVKKAAAMVWDAMLLWEECSLIPSCVSHCKLVCIPKKDQRWLNPKDFRPICVMSSLWRAWSSAWVRSGTVTNWVSKLFPPSISGGITGSLGPETVAAMVDHQLHSLNFGASLDFRHAFDTVDLGLMQNILVQTVPECMQSWAKLIFLQWKQMARWIVYDGSVHPMAINTVTGLPQGDPASPLIMNILMYHCVKEVDENSNDPSLFHMTYMDDRTLVASSLETITEAENKWSELANEFHLQENKDKAQHVQVDLIQHMEVLGALVGKPLVADDNASKAGLWLKASALRYRRISFLPLRLREKLLTANTFARSGLEYGWISSKPSTNQCKSQEIWLWRCLGRTRYASPFMRQVIFGAHSHVWCKLIMKQLRLLAKRNQALALMGIEIGKAPLDTLVENGLEDLGWIYADEFWTHPLFEQGFKIGELVDNKKWCKVSHFIRESYRHMAFNKLAACGRHDAKEINVQYDPSRRKLALKWAGANFAAILLISGALSSPYQRALLGHGAASAKCPTCGTESPGWEHLWQCVCGFIPEDGLLKRFLWPRTVQDFPSCSAFLKGFLSVGC